jgi:putative multiple sugar transport system substrate-binding protein
MIAAVTSMVMLCGMTACGTKDENGDNGKKVVGVCMPSSDLERWNTDGEYLKNVFEKAGYEVKLTFSQNDPTRQNNDVLGILNDGVDLLLIAAVDGNALAKPLDEAMAKGVPVVAYDRLIMNTKAITYYISFDNLEVGKLQGTYIRDALDLDNTAGPYNMEIVSGDSADNNARMFFDGAYDILEPYFQSGKLRVLSGNTTFEDTATKGWTTSNAEKNMKKTFGKYYTNEKLDAVLCANDSTALGVTKALAGNYKGAEQPVITGQDGDIDNLKNIIDGKQAMTVFKNVRDEASVAFEVSKRILNGETPTGRLIDSLAVDVRYDTESYQNGAKYVQSYLLVPTVLTKDNLQVMVNTGMYQWDASGKYIEAVTKAAAE